MAQLTLDQTFQIGLQHQQAGRLAQAEQLYRQILAQQPNHAPALHFLGLVAHQVGRYDAAAELIRRAIALNPSDGSPQSNLARVLLDMGKPDEALSASRAAIALMPRLPEAHYNLGSAFQAKGQLDEAITAYRQAIALNPNLVEAHNNLGNALKDKGQLDEAIATLQQAISLRPNYAEAHSNLGIALRAAGKADEAIAAYWQAIALKPNLAEIHSNLGRVLQESGRPDEAIAACRRAIALRPDLLDAYCNLGNALKDSGQLDAAIAAYRQAIALKPGYLAAHDNLLMAMHYHPTYDAHAIAAERRCWNRQHAEPLKSLIESTTPVRRNDAIDRDPARRLRIGYVSADFWAHASGHFLVPLFERHDPRQVEIFCYAQVLRPDAITRRLQQRATGWRKTVGLRDEKVAQQIRDDRIDILVDLKMHTADNRLLVFARKPAPVQVAWLGYPGSTGLTAIDYRLSDPYLDPPGMDESVYSEKTIRLPDSFWCYDPLDGREVPINSLSALETGVITFGCLNNFCKINERILALWGQVMNNVPGSRLVLLAGQGAHRHGTVEILARQGVDPSRVEFLDPRPRRQYLEAYHRIDVGLDSFPYNGHTTSLDSFWMGVPVVTLVGQTAVSRAGWCQLSNLGLAELAGKSPEQFVRIASELASDLPRLANLRSTLRRRMEQSPLMDAARFAGDIEAAYRRIWRSWCDKPPIGS